MQAVEEENVRVNMDLEKYGRETQEKRKELREKVDRVDETMFTSFKSISELLQACISEQRELDGLEQFISENGIREY